MKRWKISNVIISIGAVMILFALLLFAYNVVEAEQAWRRANAALSQLVEEMEGETVLLPGQPAIRPTLAADEDSDVMSTIEINGVEYLGTITIPGLGIELPVMAEWSYEGLLTAPGRYSGSVWTDDFVVCAHDHDRHFGQIKNLNVGDEVLFQDVDGNISHYRVLAVMTLEPTAVEEMATGGWWDMTMFTCTLGGATRVTVRCGLSEE